MKGYKPVTPPAPRPKPRNLTSRDSSLRRLEDEIAVRTYYEFLDDPNLVQANSEVPSDRMVRASSNTRIDGRNRSSSREPQTTIRSTSKGRGQIQVGG